jgi:hypothetical protein
MFKTKLHSLEKCVTVFGKLTYAYPPQKSMILNQSIDSIQPIGNNKSSTLSGVRLCKVRLELFDNENIT